MNQREANRYAFRMKAKVQPFGNSAPSKPIRTWTQDVSSKGLFLEMDRPLERGTQVRLTMQLPLEVASKTVLLRCISRVVRVVARSTGKFGVGTVIENYEYVQKLEEAEDSGRGPADGRQPAGTPVLRSPDNGHSRPARAKARGRR